MWLSSSGVSEVLRSGTYSHIAFDYFYTVSLVAMVFPLQSITGAPSIVWSGVLIEQFFSYTGFSYIGQGASSGSLALFADSSGSRLSSAFGLSMW